MAVLCAPDDDLEDCPTLGLTMEASHNKKLLGARQGIYAPRVRLLVRAPHMSDLMMLPDVVRGGC
jgi:hypothetical protein